MAWDGPARDVSASSSTDPELNAIGGVLDQLTVQPTGQLGSAMDGVSYDERDGVSARKHARER